MIKYLFSCTLLVIANGSILVGQSMDSLLTKYHDSHHIEKLYIANDKPYYFPEETIWGAIYLVDGSDHLLIDGDIVATVEVIEEDETVLSTLNVKIKDGRGAFNIDLDDVVTPGTYTLRAYTAYQTNFDPSYIFQKKLAIINDYSPSEADSIEEISLSFYPEGGYLIHGISSKVAFQAIDQSGAPTNINGVILDNLGNEIQKIKTQKNGLGVFNIVPERTKVYAAVIRIGKKDYTFSLPMVLPEGITINCTSTKKENILIGISTNKPVGLAGASIIGHARGLPFLSQQLGSKPNEIISLLKNELPDGILHFTVFDDQRRPVAERLIYNHGKSSTLEVNIVSTDTISAMTTSDIGLSLDAASSLDSATATISIYNETLNPGLIDHLSIKNYLLLQSDLRGRIHNINDYFIKDDPQTRYLLDILTMVHGWRRFDWLEVINNQAPEIVVPPSYYTSYKGQVTTQKGRTQPNTQVSLSIIKDDQLEFRTTTSSDEGLFAFDNIDLTDTVSMIITSSTDDKKNKIKIIETSKPELKEVPPLANYNTMIRSFPTDAPAIVRAVREQLISESLWSIQLDNVTVQSSMNRAQKLTIEAAQRYNEKGLYHISSSQKFDPTEPRLEQYLQQSVFEMIQHVATRFTLVNEGGVKRLYIRYGDPLKRSEPPIFIDGIRVSPQYLESIDPKTIALIDIPEGPVAASVYGAPLVISLLTKKPEEITELESETLTLIPSPYHFSATYYDRYPASVVPSPDLRTCLYWNPHMKIGTETTSIPFKASEMKGDHILKIEGISFDGQPFLSYRQFFVE